jgi:hypothetical protein
MSDRQPGTDLTYSVRAEPRGGYLRVVMSGERSTLAAAIAGWREAGRLIHAHGARRVLIVSQMTGPIPSPEDQRATMRALAGHGFEGVRTALVLEDSRNVGLLEHGEMQSREMGQESRVFGSEALADVWLRLGDSGEIPARRR